MAGDARSIPQANQVEVAMYVCVYRGPGAGGRSTSGGVGGVLVVLVVLVGEYHSWCDLHDYTAHPWLGPKADKTLELCGRQMRSGHAPSKVSLTPQCRTPLHIIVPVPTTHHRPSGHYKLLASNLTSARTSSTSSGVQPNAVSDSASRSPRNAMSSH